MSSAACKPAYIHPTPNKLNHCTWIKKDSNFDVEDGVLSTEVANGKSIRISRYNQ
jgi:hypothetical protein